VVALAFAAVALPGCSSSHSQQSNGSNTARVERAPTKLTARLADPINIDLKWDDNAKGESGYFVEYSPHADGQFVLIEVVPPNTTRYRHPHLLPETRFVFRVRPFFGEVSNVAEVTTGKEGPQQLAPEESTTNAPPPSGVVTSLRSASTSSSAAPTDVTAVLVPPAGVKLDWKDHAKDEDGFLLEIKPEWSPEFVPSSYIAPGTTSMVSYGFPFETRFAFRIRAFFYGEPSNLAEQTTGKDPAMGGGSWIKMDPSAKP